MFRLKDYIFVPKDVLDLSKRLWHWSHFTDWLGIFILLIYVLVFGYFFSLAPEPLFFIGFIIATIYFELDSRVSIALALLCLLCVPLLLALFNNNILFQGEIWAESVAVWAYYFLVIGVVRQIFEYRADSKGEIKENEILETKAPIKKDYQHVVNLKKS